MARMARLYDSHGSHGSLARTARWLARLAGSHGSLARTLSKLASRTKNKYAKANRIHICPEHFTDNIERKYFRSALKRRLYNKLIYSKEIIVLGRWGVNKVYYGNGKVVNFVFLC